MENATSHLQRLQFIAANYSRLQGLRALPVGLVLFLICFWANAQQGPVPRPILPPLAIAAAGAAGYWWIDRYYRRKFGEVVALPHGHLDWVIEIGGAGFALLAFFVENSARSLVFSPTTLVLALAVFFDYARLIRFSHVHYLQFWLVIPLILVGIGLLPVLGAGEWWYWIGAKVQILGALMLSGLVLVLAAFISHFAFLRLISEEAKNGRRI